MNLIVNPLPTVNALADFSVCIDDTIQVLTANVSGVFGPVLALLTQMVISHRL
ncbi:MAG: hypothetical protein CM15mP65_00110 [Crocinitomicaceae bacterium]|nr:MAG: hypothetical protein CM15mP65_00110 [Crocinitomicaceae bacterium]